MSSNRGRYALGRVSSADPSADEVTLSPRSALATIWLVLSCFGTGCYCSNRYCEPELSPAVCRGNGWEACVDLGGWSVGTALEGHSCAPEEECVDLGGGQVGCVIPPASPCDPVSFEGRCVGRAPTVCARPAGFIEGSYEIRGTPCEEWWEVCRMVDGHAACVPTPAIGAE